MGTTYAIGDLHGEVTLLRVMLAQLPLHPDDRLIFLGDYMDRGEDSVATVFALRELAATQPCVFLRGNHDQEWLDCFTGTAFRRCPSMPGARKVWDDQHGLVPPAVGLFLDQTLFSYADGYAYYAHAGAQPGVPCEHTPREVLLWGWHDFLSETSGRWGLPVVFGHYELPEPLIGETKIGLDTAAYRTGILTAMCIPTRQVFQVTKDGLLRASSHEQVNNDDY